MDIREWGDKGEDSIMREHLMTLQCINKECLARLRVGRILSLPSTRIGAFSFCPLCGGEASAHTDTDETYMEVLAKSYDLPVPVLKQLLDLWNPREYTKFHDFIQDLKKEALAESA